MICPEKASNLLKKVPGAPDENQNSQVRLKNRHYPEFFDRLFGYFQEQSSHLDT